MIPRNEAVMAFFCCKNFRKRRKAAYFREALTTRKTTITGGKKHERAER
jgi:hypothetical protein